jgi:hypothetical protein
MPRADSSTAKGECTRVEFVCDMVAFESNIVDYLFGYDLTSMAGKSSVRLSQSLDPWSPILTGSWRSLRNMVQLRFGKNGIV